MQSKWIRNPPIEHVDPRETRAEIVKIISDRKVLLLSRALTVVERIDEESTKIDLAIMTERDRELERVLIVQALRFLSCVFLAVANYSLTQNDSTTAEQWLRAIFNQGLKHAVMFFLKPTFWFDFQNRRESANAVFGSDIVARAAWCFCNITCFSFGAAAVTNRELASIISLCQVPRKEREIARW